MVSKIWEWGKKEITIQSQDGKKKMNSDMHVEY